MKTFLAGILLASTMAIAIPEPASALGIHIGPRGVGVGLGVRGYRGRYRRGFVRRPVIVRPGYRRHWHRF